MTDIIERLDALGRDVSPNKWTYDDIHGVIEGWDVSFTCDCGINPSDAQWAVALHNAYPELRAELLRLQEERNRWQRSHEDLRHLLKDFRDRGDVVERERDALLEALAMAKQVAECGLLDSKATKADLLRHLYDVKAELQEAIARVEGKDG